VEAALLFVLRHLLLDAFFKGSLSDELHGDVLLAVLPFVEELLGFGNRLLLHKSNLKRAKLCGNSMIAMKDQSPYRRAQ
jgi:hypothetical protein